MPKTLTTMSTLIAPPKTRYRFSGHETFPFRYTWLTKGIQESLGVPDLFTRDDAVVTLGVGKNMVKSIRHWCECMALLRPKDRGAHVEPTDLGRSLFGQHGWDPYLEDVGTLWLLHWLLVSSPEHASTWHLAFTQWNPGIFSIEDLLKWLDSVVPDDSRATANSLRRDAEVFLRTYVPGGRTKSLTPEDTFDCPLVELGLIQCVDKTHYRFTRGAKPSLPDSIFWYAIVEFWSTTRPNQRTMSFETVLHSAGSPGAAFKLDEKALCDMLERAPAKMGISFDETAGLRQLLLAGEITDIMPLEILRAYYAK